MVLKNKFINFSSKYDNGSGTETVGLDDKDNV